MEGDLPMCIIVAKKKGLELPTKEILENCFTANDDGAGISWNTDNGTVIIEKGFMTFNEFYNRLLEIDNEYNLKDRGVLMHFRITTHGGTSQQNCHPFPISSSLRDLKELKMETSISVAHNGIMSKFNPPTGANHSDTMEFIKTWLISCYEKDNEFAHNPKTRSKIASLIGSKLAILEADGTINVVGDFITEEDGMLYSNSSYESYVKWYYTPSTTKYSKSWKKSYNNVAYGYGYDEWEDYYNEDYGYNVHPTEDDYEVREEFGKGFWTTPCNFNMDIDKFTEAISDITIIDANKVVLLDDDTMIVTDDTFTIGTDKFGLLYKVNWEQMTLAVANNNYVLEIMDESVYLNKEIELIEIEYTEELPF
jgi:predicted glutamine amidotransferase